MQRVGMRNRFIDYHQDRGQGLDHYMGVLQQKRQEHGYVYGTAYMPHDANVTDYSREDGKSRREVVESYGYEVEVVPRVELLGTGIELTRQAFRSVWIDKDRCEIGINALDAYRYPYDEKTQTTRKTPLHNWASNGADAFQQFGQGFAVADSHQISDNNPLARRTRKTHRRRRTGNSNRV